MFLVADITLFLSLFFAFVIILLLIVHLFDSSSHLKIVKNLPELFNKKIYGYLDKSGEVLNFSEKLFEELNVKGTNLKGQIKKIYYENNEISYKKFLNLLKTKEGTINVTFELESETKVLSILKVACFYKDKVVGYALMSGNQTQETTNNEIFSLVEELDSPCGYYFGALSEINFTINKKFQTLLATKSNKITYEELKSRVYEEDLEVYTSMMNEKAEDKICTYRLVTENGLMHFEEIKKIKDGKCNILISNIEVVQEKLTVTNKELNNTINSLIEENKKFGAVILSLDSFITDEQRDTTLDSDIIYKYLKNIRKDILSGEDIISSINEYEYILVIKDTERLNKITKDIIDNNSLLLKAEFGFGSKLIEINNKLGISYYDENMTKTSNFINSLYSSLALTNNEKYTKKYSVYSPVKEEKQEEEYSFDNIQIDLDNSFIHEDN